MGGRKAKLKETVNNQLGVWLRLRVAQPLLARVSNSSTTCSQTSVLPPKSAAFEPL